MNTWLRMVAVLSLPVLGPRSYYVRDSKFTVPHIVPDLNEILSDEY